MKGAELPINTLIIIVLAVIVLIAIIAMFYTGMMTPSEMASSKAVLSNACLFLINRECKISTFSIQTVNFDADKDGKVGESAANGDNLFMLCQHYYQVGCTNTLEGDADEDCAIGHIDYDILNPAYGSVCGQPKYNPAADFDGDCDVDDDDFLALAGYYGNTDAKADNACKKLCNC